MPETNGNYVERMVFENDNVIQFERVAVTGEEPTIEQLLSLVDERVSPYARFRVIKGMLRLRWYEQKETHVPVLDTGAADAGVEAERYARDVEAWRSGTKTGTLRMPSGDDPRAGHEIPPLLG